MPTISITVTAAQATTFQQDLGIAQGLVDNQTPPQPRAATAEECRQWLIGRAKQLHIDVQGNILNKAAIAAVVIPPFEPT